MELNLNKMTDHELLLIVAEHVVEQKPEVKRKLLKKSLTEKLMESATAKLQSSREMENWVMYGWRLTATIDYNGEKICTSSDYILGDPLYRQHGIEFGNQFVPTVEALAEKIASTYDLSRIGAVEAEIRIKPRGIDTL